MVEILSIMAMILIGLDFICLFVLVVSLVLAGVFKLTDMVRTCHYRLRGLCRSDR